MSSTKEWKKEDQGKNCSASLIFVKARSVINNQATYLYYASSILMGTGMSLSQTNHVRLIIFLSLIELFAL